MTDAEKRCFLKCISYRSLPQIGGYRPFCSLFLRQQLYNFSTDLFFFTHSSKVSLQHSFEDVEPPEQAQCRLSPTFCLALNSPIGLLNFFNTFTTCVNRSLLHTPLLRHTFSMTMGSDSKLSRHDRSQDRDDDRERRRRRSRSPDSRRHRSRDYDDRHDRKARETRSPGEDSHRSRRRRHSEDDLDDRDRDYKRRHRRRRSRSPAYEDEPASRGEGRKRRQRELEDNEDEGSKNKQMAVRRGGPLPSQADSFAVQNGEEVEKPREKPNFGTTGHLAAASNSVEQADGTKITLKYHEPPEARKPPSRDQWKLFVFKGQDVVDTIDLSNRSCWLVGREAAVVDLLAEHPSISKQHAVMQFRYAEKRNEYGDKIGKVKLYLLDLESANGTKLNGEVVPDRRYLELRPKDVVKFGDSTREYVIILSRD